MLLDAFRAPGGKQRKRADYSDRPLNSSRNAETLNRPATQQSGCSVFSKKAASGPVDENGYPYGIRFSGRLSESV
jgi:hypothetical protein